MIRRTKHTRYLVRDGSLDQVLGVLHVKDLIGLQLHDGFKLQSIMRPPKFGATDADSMSGLLMDFAHRIVNAGDVVDLRVAQVKVLEVADDRTTSLRINLPDSKPS